MANVPQEILNLLARAENDDVLPATDLFNEGWMLRLLLALEEDGVRTFPFAIASGASWMSEGLLYTPFSARTRSDSLAEKHTHADGIVGHLQIESGTKRGISLKESATQFIVLEAKMFSRLSKGTTHAPGYDQATRNVVCMAETIRRYAQNPAFNNSWPPLDDVGFFVVAPERQIKKGHFKEYLKVASIRRKVVDRISQYPESDQKKRFEGFISSFLDPLLKELTGKISTLSWESLIDQASKSDAGAGSRAESFYRQCLRYNKR